MKPIWSQGVCHNPFRILDHLYDRAYYQLRVLTEMEQEPAEIWTLTGEALAYHALVAGAVRMRP